MIKSTLIATSPLSPSYLLTIPPFILTNIDSTLLCRRNVQYELNVCGMENSGSLLPRAREFTLTETGVYIKVGGGVAF